MEIEIDRGWIICLFEMIYIFRSRRVVQFYLQQSWLVRIEINNLEKVEESLLESLVVCVNRSFPITVHDVIRVLSVILKKKKNVITYINLNEERIRGELKNILKVEY